MSKLLFGSLMANAVLAIFALKAISSLNMEIGGLKVEIIAQKSKTERYKALYETEHQLIMENSSIDKKVKERIERALNTIIRAYDGTINPN